MKFSHTEDQRENQHLDILTDEENGMRIVVSRLGAELVSLARVNETGEWTGFLYRDNDLSAPSQGWANHATVMDYYLHRLKDGRSLYRGREIKGGNHGFLRSKTWHFAGTSLQGSGASLEYRITPNDFSADEYPLNVSVAVTYFKCPEDFTAVTFRREIIFPNKRAISSSRVAKCRFRKRNCPAPSFSSFSTFRGVNFPMLIRQAAAGLPLI